MPTLDLTFLTCPICGVLAGLKQDGIPKAGDPDLHMQWHRDRGDVND